MNSGIQLIGIILAIDCVAAIIVVSGVIFGAEYFWEMTQGRRQRVLMAMLLTSGSIFLLCIMMFTVIHVWAWAPVNIAHQYAPFKVTWQTAMLLASFVTFVSARPLKRTLTKHCVIET